MSLHRKDPHAQDAPAPQDVDVLQTVKNAIRMRIVHESFGKREYLKNLGDKGMSMDDLGVDQIRRLELGGLQPSLVERVLKSVKRVTHWPKLWELAGDELLADGDHRAAAMAYQYGTHWVIIRDEMRKHLLDKAVTTYRQGVHGAPLESIYLDVAGRKIAAYLQVPENADGPSPVVVLFPGITAFKEEMHLQAELFLAENVAVCRIDLPGHGETEGVIDWPWMDEIPNAIMGMLDNDPRIDSEGIYTAGVCAGGIFATICAHSFPVAEVILVSTPFDPLNFLMNGTTPMYEALENAMGVEIGEVVDLFASADIPKRNEGILSSLLLFYGEKDPMVPAFTVDQFAEATRGPVTTFLYPDQQHACIGRMDEIFFTVISRINERRGRDEQVA